MKMNKRKDGLVYIFYILGVIAGVLIAFLL